MEKQRLSEHNMVGLDDNMEKYDIIKKIYKPKTKNIQFYKYHKITKTAIKQFG